MSVPAQDANVSTLGAISVHGVTALARKDAKERKSVDIDIKGAKKDTTSLEFTGFVEHLSLALVHKVTTSKDPVSVRKTSDLSERIVRVPEKTSQGYCKAFIDKFTPIRNAA